jgi:hypothetical protein
MAETPGRLRNVLCTGNSPHAAHATLYQATLYLVSNTHTQIPTRTGGIVEFRV